MAKSPAGIIDGTPISMGGSEWIVPPLTIQQYLRLLPIIKQAMSSQDDQAVPLVVEVVTAALQRNYPNLTAEMVENMLDLGNLVPAYIAALSRNSSFAAPFQVPPTSTLQ